MVAPGASKFLVDDIFVGGEIQKLNILLLVVGLAMAVQAVTGFALVKLLSVEAHHFISKLRISIYQHIMNLPLSFFNREKSGAIVSRIMNDVEGVRNLIGTGLVQLFGGILSSCLALFFLIRINQQMTIASILILVLFALVMMKAFQTIRPIMKSRQRIHAEVTGRLTETIGGIKVIKGFAAEGREEKVFASGVLNLYENVKKSLTATALVTMITQLLIGVITCLVMGISAYAVLHSSMTTGDFIAYLLYLALLTFPIIQMSNIGTQITEAFAGLDRMNEVYTLTTETDDPKRNKILHSLKKPIVFENVRFRYSLGYANQELTDEEQTKKDREVIRGVSFEIREGEVVALVGNSGSGKSTLASLALSLMSPSSGRILIGGQDLQEIKLKTFRSRLAVVLQDDFLFDGSIRDNLLFSKSTATTQEINRAVKAAYVHEFTDKFENGLNTIIGERGVRLSGGQKQRISIARAILANPDFLVLDEATSSLDNKSEMYIQKSLKSLFKDCTTLIIAHRLSTIERADTILMVEDGKIAEAGNYKTLMRKKGKFHNLYTYQARI